MSKIAFIGLGNMGGPMARNLVKAGHKVTGFDLSPDALAAAEAAGIAISDTALGCLEGAETVVTMLPAGPQVSALYLGADGLLAKAAPGTLFIESSTIDVATARQVHAAALATGQAMLDAPVSGGVAGAEAATLTFMCGGTDEAFARATEVLGQMGKNIIHAGGAGNGQVAKTCNNMILGISMIAISEAFTLGQALGLEPEKLFAISSKASGSCWAMLNHNPVPGLVETSAANRDYKPGFAAAMMLKDLSLSQAAAGDANAKTPLGAAACDLYDAFVKAGHGGEDYSAIIKMIAALKGARLS